MTETAVEQVWEGSDALRPFLVAIDDLEPFPGNPRRGDVAVIRSSLRRFGQVRPILVVGARIVAGHHLVLSAQEEGWTHVAAIPNDFKDEAEARAYLLADNRTSELGTVENELLAAQLREVEILEGTGYSDADRQRLEQELRDLFAEQEESPPRLDERDPKYSTQPRGFEVTLYLVGEDVKRDFAQHVKILEKEWGVAGASDVVVRAVRDAAHAANQGT